MSNTFITESLQQITFQKYNTGLSKYTEKIK